MAVLHRVADSEESIQDLVGKVFHGLWFASKREGQYLSSYPLHPSCNNRMCIARPSGGAFLPAFQEGRRCGTSNPGFMRCMKP